MRGFWPPPIWVPAELPHRKWLGRRGGLWISAAGAAFFLYLLLVGGLALHNGAAVTIGLLVGAVTVAASFLYTMAYRVGPRDTVTVPLLLIAFGFGGLLSVTVGSTTDSLLVKLSGQTSAQTSTLVLLLAGISEELAKIIAVVIVSWKLRDKSVRNGLFVGGAVGLGFAALEDLSYATNFFENPPSILHLTHLGSALLFVPIRALLTPFGHPLWTALFSAGLFAATRNGRFRVTWRVIVAYLGVAVAHGLWDGSAGVLNATGIKPLVALELVILPGIVVGSGLIWIHVARRARWEFQTPVAWWRSAPPVPSAVLPPPPPQGPPSGQPLYPAAPVAYPAAPPAYAAAPGAYPAAPPAYAAAPVASPAAPPAYAAAPVASPAAPVGRPAHPEPPEAPVWAPPADSAPRLADAAPRSPDAAPRSPDVVAEDPSLPRRGRHS